YNIFNDQSSYKVLQVLRELHNAACRMSSSDRKSFIDQRDRQTVSRSRMERVKSHLDAAVSTLTDYPQWSGKDAARWLTKVLESDESTIARDFASKSAAEFTRELASAAKLEDSRKGNRESQVTPTQTAAHSVNAAEPVFSKRLNALVKMTEAVIALGTIVTTAGTEAEAQEETEADPLNVTDSEEEGSAEGNVNEKEAELEVNLLYATSKSQQENTTSVTPVGNA
ncbi:hypothetical protein HDU99_001093, partial [Rhizoclosmatium hyalinum]